MLLSAERHLLYPAEPFKLIVFNAPARQGKDTAAKYLGKLYDSPPLSFAEPLKLATHAAFGLYDVLGRPTPWDTYEECKDIPSLDFYGHTPREAYINHAEKYFKPLYGRGVYADLLLRRLKPLHSTYCGIISDLGFIEELTTLINGIGAENILLIRLHRTGGNTLKDSRCYLHSEAVQAVDITSGNVGDLKKQVRQVALSFQPLKPILREIS